MARKHKGKPLNWSFEKRFMSKIKVTESGCWEWQRGKSGNGYGMLKILNVNWMAHRYSYTQLVGEIPENHDLDHLCRNRACTNPAHLEPVTRSVNLNRGVKKTLTPLKTHCIHGHEYTPENTYTNGNSRTCRTCQAEREKANRKVKKGIKNG